MKPVDWRWAALLGELFRRFVRWLRCLMWNPFNRPDREEPKKDQQAEQSPAEEQSTSDATASPAPDARPEPDTAAPAEPVRFTHPAPGEEAAPAAREQHGGAKPAAPSGDEADFVETDDEEPEQPPPTLLGQGAYNRSDEYLWDELLRIDQLVRAQTRRWRLTIGATKSDDLWGMILVSDKEVRAYLGQKYQPPEQLSGRQKDIAERYQGYAAELAQAIRLRVEQTPPHIPLRLVELTRLFGLDDLQRDLLLVCLLPELDARYRRLFGYLQDDASRTRPTVELALQIVRPHEAAPEAGRAALASTSPLLLYHLLALSGGADGEEPLPMRSLRVDDRIAAYLLGGNAPSAADAIDARLDGIAVRGQLTQDWHSLDREKIAELAAWWRRRREEIERAPGQVGAAQPARMPGAAMFLQGPYGSGRRATAQAICAATQTPLLISDVPRALRARDGWAQIVDLAYREAALLGAALYWARGETLLEREQSPHHWEYLTAAAERFQGLTFFAGQSTWEPAGQFHERNYLRMEFPAPHYTMRRQLWEQHLPQAWEFAAGQSERALLAQQLANNFQLTDGQVLDAVATARALALAHTPQQPRLTDDHLYEACRRQSGQRLMALAQRIEPRAGLAFDDLKLPPQYEIQLDELRDRIRYRNEIYVGMGFEQRLSLGKGLVALFTGPSGTGKTMAAERLAGEQQVDLYKIDLSAVVSKYVGETEKNLGRIFAEAEDANAVLFFDEADALFGKRGEIKEAHDRWANIETNYLLQRIEEYAGVVILTSNLRQNIDEAFLRRIHVIVEFPFPDETRRFEIWSNIFPPGVVRPTRDDIQALADQFRLTGGSIKNIALDAAFRARAAKESSISIRHLVAGIAREYQKLGKPITKGEFGERFYAWVEQDILAPTPRSRGHIDRPTDVISV
jgi:AAA+ superfamily predicted ATPase